jgi:DNA replication protein DnaC
MSAAIITAKMGYDTKKNRPDGVFLFIGPTGVGKTDIVTQACQEANARLIISHPVVSDPTDYKGLPFADPDGKTARFLPFGDLAELSNAKEETVFFLDDLGQAPASVVLPAPRYPPRMTNLVFFGSAVAMAAVMSSGC